MFQHQTITIKSGSGDNLFEATATIDTMASDSQTKTIMENLKQMQKDRMEWAASKKPGVPLGQREVATK